MLSDDMHVERSRFGEIEISGESLLEAIAHHTQTAKAERVLGIEASRAVQKDVPENAIVSQRYTWAYRLPRGIGVERLRDPPTEWGRQFEALGLNPE
jgi:hypothetical protein